MFGRGKGRPKNVAKVVEAEPPKVEPQKPMADELTNEKAYRIVEGVLLDSGLIRYVIISNVSLGAIGEEFKIEE